MNTTKDLTSNYFAKPERQQVNYKAGFCCVEVRIYTGSLYSSYAGCYSQCSKNPRKGCLTCYWHQKFEAEAQEAKLAALARRAALPK